MIKIIVNRKSKSALQFWMRDQGGYIYLIDDHHPGTLGQQITDRNGNCLFAYDRASFDRLCRAYYLLVRESIEFDYEIKQAEKGVRT